MKSVSIGPQFEVIGHRGNPGNPFNSRNIENTIPSFNDAWHVGVNGVELDVHLTKDGVLVIHHDDELGRVFQIPQDDNKRLVSEYSWEELQKAELNLTRIKNDLRPKIDERCLDLAIDRFSGVTIPKLEDLLPLPEGKKLFLELKFEKDIEPTTAKGKEYLTRLVKATAQFLKERALIDSTYVLSFVPSALLAIKNEDPKITTAYNVWQDETTQPNNEQKIDELKRQYKFNAVNPPFEQATKDSISLCHNLGLETYPWVWKQGYFEEKEMTYRILMNKADGTINNLANVLSLQ